MNYQRKLCLAGILLLPMLFLLGAKAPPKPSGPTTTPAEQEDERDRFDAKLQLSKSEKFDLILVGDSITSNLENRRYKAIWDEFYAPRHALDLGFSGGRTQNTLWNLDHGILDGQSPKVITLLIGTNNADEKNYGTHYTAEEIAQGIEAVVAALAKAPGAKILFIRILPYGHTPNPRRERNDRASELAAAKVVDGQHVFYCDVNHLFLNLDGSMKQDLARDFLHPTPAGAELMAEAIEPTLSELMGDKPLGKPLSQNTALIPVPKLEDDVYDWWARHAAEVELAKTLNPQIVLIGDSITHFWAGQPEAKIANGREAWKTAFGDLPVMNLGFGWDRTQNVLWRLDHGEFDGLHPKTVVINIGTNNFTATDHAKANTPAEVCQGVLAICERVRSKSPDSRLIVMGVFPREQKADNEVRAKIAVLNELLAKALASTPKVTFLDIGSQLTQPDGSISPQIMADFVHPAEAGYAIWAKALLAAGVRD